MARKKLKLEDIPKKTHFWLITREGERHHVFRNCSGKISFDHPGGPVPYQMLENATFEPWENET